MMATNIIQVITNMKLNNNKKLLSCLKEMEPFVKNYKAFCIWKQNSRTIIGYTYRLRNCDSIKINEYEICFDQDADRSTIKEINNMNLEKLITHSGAIMFMEI